MDMTLKKKLLLTLLLSLFTTSFIEGKIIKLLATCQGPSQRRHIKFLMTLTRVCFAIVGQIPVCLTLFILCRQYYNDLLFILVSIFTYMEILRIVLWVEGVFNFFYYSMPVSLGQYRGENGLF